MKFERSFHVRPSLHCLELISVPLKNLLPLPYLKNANHCSIFKEYVKSKGLAIQAAGC
jgi:hypothetical protein